MGQLFISTYGHPSIVTPSYVAATQTVTKPLLPRLLTRDLALLLRLADTRDAQFDPDGLCIIFLRQGSALGSSYVELLLQEKMPSRFMYFSSVWYG